MNVKYIKLALSAAVLVAASALSGCATMVVGAGDLLQANVSSVDNKLLTATVAWQEPKAPMGYPRAKFGWSDAPESVHKLRWAIASTTVAGHGFGTIYQPLSVVIPSGVPTLHSGDLVAVQNNVFLATNYSTMNVPFVVRLICRAGDKNCMKQVKEKHDGKLVGVILPGHYDRSQFTFTPRDQKVASAGDQ